MQIKPRFIGQPNPRARTSRRRSASETLEMAMALPLLLLLAFGTVEFGFWFYLEHNFQSAAREAARAACVVTTNPSDRLVKAREVADQFMLNLGYGPEKFELRTNESDVINGVQYLTVTVEANWAEIGVETGLFIKLRNGTGESELVDDTTKIRGTATMRIES